MRLLALLALAGGCTWPAPPELPACQDDEPCTASELELRAAFGPKQVELSWNPYGDATTYRVYQASDGTTFAQVGDDLPATALMMQLPVSVHRTSWPTVRFRVEACVGDACVRSQDLAIGDAMVSAIGYVKASNTDAIDKFGFAVAISTSGDTLAIGAYSEASNASADQLNNGAPECGAVYVFERSNTEWRQEAYLKANNAETWDNFGRSIALSDDGSTLAVGARLEDGSSAGVGGTETDNSLAEAGAAYVFVRSGTSWFQQAYLKASNPGAGDFFGDSVALSGDGSTLAVGAVIEASAADGINGDQSDDTAPEAGAVYVFERTAGAWSQQAYLKASNSGPMAHFGASLALSNDGNTLVAGAAGERSASTGIDGNQQDTAAANAGAVYVFTRSGSSWAQQAYVKPTHVRANDHVGWSVALDGDGDTLAVGAKGESNLVSPGDALATNAGAVFVFTRTGSTWSQSAYLKPAFVHNGYEVGWRVALSDDGTTIAASAPGDASSARGVGGSASDDRASSAGAVVVFSRDDATWHQVAYVKASNPDANDRFGMSLGMSGDGSTLAVGAPYEASRAKGIGGDPDDNAAMHAGAVYLY
ncbi:MAG: integrin [Kofleriaceae bacterium]